MADGFCVELRHVDGSLVAACFSGVASAVNAADNTFHRHRTTTAQVVVRDPEGVIVWSREMPPAELRTRRRRRGLEDL